MCECCCSPLRFSLATGLLCSLAPLSHLAKVDPVHVIKDVTASVAGGLSLRRQNLTKGALVVTEIALATVLLVGAGLLVRSFVLLSSVPFGHHDNVLTFQVVMPRGRLADGQLRRAADEEILTDFVCFRECRPPARPTCCRSRRSRCD